MGKIALMHSDNLVICEANVQAKEKKRPSPFDILFFVYTVLLSVFFLSVFSYTTSPLTDCVGYDSAFFRLVGSGIKQGYLPYRDFFDTKGPYLFLIEYAAQLISSGRLGIFILQCINLIVALNLSDRILTLFVKRERSSDSKSVLAVRFITPLLVLFIAAFTFEGGNLTEEFSLCFLLSVLYFALKYGKYTPGEDHPTKWGFFYGVCFGVLAFIRITNAAVVGAAVIAVSFSLLKGKRFVSLLKNAVFFLLGALAATLPACLYFALHSSLSDMLYQVFYFGVVYSSEIPFTDKLHDLFTENAAELSLLLIPIVSLSLFRVKDAFLWVLSVFSSVFSLIVISLGNNYLHYFTLVIPIVILGIAISLRSVTQAKKDSLFIPACTLLIAFVALCYHGVMPRFNEYCSISSGHINSNASDPYASSVSEIKEMIPMQDRDRVYVIGVGSCSAFYVRADILPPHKYCDWQEHYMALSEPIERELSEWLEGGEAKWIVTDASYEFGSPILKDAIKKSYVRFYSNETFTLYKVFCD